MLFKDLKVRIDSTSTYPDILDSHAMKFLADLTRKFRPLLSQLLEEREKRQCFYDEGYEPNFLQETGDIRESEWKVAKIPDDLRDRRVEITGPTDRKMVINALNSGANVFMADFEDSLSPTWKNILTGQRNLRDAINRTISYTHPTKGEYRLNNEVSTLFVRPRGLHMNESHFSVDDEPIPASLFDFGLFLFHNSKNLVESGTGPYFYLPKLEHYLEARWWNEVFNWSQDYINIPRGSIRATVLIETLPASFQMNEILWELRDHSAGLNCGRWDYIFSYIKTFRNHSDKILPDRNKVTMTNNFMKSYSELVIYTCHRRGIHAMGGMAAQIPIKNDENSNNVAMSKVREDKVREVLSGHDGTWVAHPGLISIVRDIFDRFMPDKNQINKVTENNCTRYDLLESPTGEITELGLRKNINVGILYIEAWLSGNGCVPLYNLMEDAATAEISRTQVWQWIKHERFTIEEFREILNDELNKIKYSLGENKFKEGKYDIASQLFEKLSTSSDLVNFLTLPAYKLL